MRIVANPSVTQVFCPLRMSALLVGVLALGALASATPADKRPVAHSGTAMIQITADGTVKGQPDAALTDTEITAKIQRVLKKPFVEGWDHYVDCCNSCRDEG